MSPSRYDVDAPTTASVELGDRGGAPEVEEEISLLVHHREGAEVVRLFPGRSVIIGRSPPSTLVIRDQTLSRVHARFDVKGRAIWIEDLESTNGTRVNGKGVVRSQVRPGDQVALGGAISVSVIVVSPGRARPEGFRGHDLFCTLLDNEIVRSRAFGRRVGLLMIRAPAGWAGDLGRWCLRVRDLLRPVDQMAVYGANIIEVALPETSRSEVRSVVQAVVDGRSADEPMLSCGVALFPDDATSAEELIEVCRSAVMETTEKELIAWAPSRASGAARRPSGFPKLGSGAPAIRSASMLALYKAVDRLAQSVIPVLIEGETGTGKEVVAHAIHERGRRRDKKLVSINCGAVPESLIESTLFGHERGAFTGATESRQGIFEAADGGTVLLDEVGELAHAAQVSLLRVLETKCVRRVGATEERTVDVRVLAATHRDLEVMCLSGGFRWDLFYRLNAMTLRIPPLRERLEDIRDLAAYFLERANEANARSLRGLTEGALEKMRSYEWPGNVRELRNVIERAVVIAEGPLITLEDLPERLRRRSTPLHMDAFDDDGDPTMNVASLPMDDLPERMSGDDAAEDFRTRVEKCEMALIVHALAETHGNRSRAAKELRIPLRTLKYKIVRYGLDRKDGSLDCGARLPDEVRRILADGEREALDFRTIVQKFEERLIRDALEHTRWNKSGAAKRLRIPLRTLTDKIEALRIRG